MNKTKLKLVRNTVHQIDTRRIRMNVVLDKWAFMPEKAHPEDAGWDIRTPYRVMLRKRDSVTIDSGVHIQIPKGCVGMLKSKSGLNVNHGITSEGVIDSGYTGSICVKLYNNSDKHYIFEQGDKITQLVIMPITMDELELVEEFEGETERGNNGFGSSGR